MLRHVCCLPGAPTAVYKNRLLYLTITCQFAANLHMKAIPRSYTREFKIL